MRSRGARRRHPPGRPRPCVALPLALIGVLAAACASRDGRGDEATTAGSPVGWSSQVLGGEPGPDQPTVLASDGSEVVVATTSEAGVITGHATDESGELATGAPTETGLAYLGLGGAARLGDGWIAVGSGGLAEEDGDGQLLFEVHAFGSDDGRTWRDLGASGLDGPADVTGVVAVDGGVVAVGTARTAPDPSIGGFRPVAWHTSDGDSWTAVALPLGPGAGGSATAAVASGDEVLAVGRIDERGAMWSSADGGASWSIAERDGIPRTSSLDDVAAQGDVLVASGTVAGADPEAGERAPLLVRSGDGGRTWAVAGSPPPAGLSDYGGVPLFAGPGQFFATQTTVVDAWAQPEVCYADIELCRQDNAVALYASDDGDTWGRVDTSGIGEGEAGEVEAVAGTADGRLVALTRDVRGLVASTWPGGALPGEAEPVAPTSDARLLGEGERPEPGVRYGVPLYIHCGMDWLYVGGEPWRRSDAGPDTETGAGDPVPDGWPAAQQTIFGFATLVDGDLIEYSIGDGEVIATYAPATEQPPGCE